MLKPVLPRCLLPIFVLFCFVLPSHAAQGSLVAEITANPNTGPATTTALSLSAGDFVFVACGGDAANIGGSDNYTVTSSPANTWNQLPNEVWNNFYAQQSSYALNVGAGLTTFTCTGDARSYGVDIIVKQYRFPTPIALDTQVGSITANGGGPNNYTSPYFSTTAANELIVFCSMAQFGNSAFSAGTIGGRSAADIISSRNDYDNMGLVCEDLITTSTQSSITATINSNTSQGWGGTVATFAQEAGGGGSGGGGGHRVTLAWNNVEGATNYNIYRLGVKIGSTAANTYTDTTVVAGQIYSYTVTSVNSSGESAQEPVTMFKVPQP